MSDIQMMTECFKENSAADAKFNPDVLGTEKALLWNEVETGRIEPLTNLLSWAGGAVDTGCSITIVKQVYQSDKNGNKRKDGYRLKFIITRKDKATIDRIYQILDCKGHINPVTVNGVKNSLYQLQYDGKHAHDAIERVAPFLFRKRVHAFFVDQFWKDCKMGQRPGSKGWGPEVIELRKRYMEYFKWLNSK